MILNTYNIINNEAPLSRCENVSKERVARFAKASLENPP